MKNLRRVMDMLPRATLSPGSDNALLERLYNATMTQWLIEMRSVAELIGGFTVQYKSGSQPGPVYTPIPAPEQRAAMKFLDTMAFHAPRWLVAPQITRRFEMQGAATRLVANQNAVLGRVLSERRLERMAEVEASAAKGDDVYSRAELLGDLRRSLWSELHDRKVAVGFYRRELQQTHLVLLREFTKRLFNASVSPYDVEYAKQVRPTHYYLMYSELQVLRGEINAAIPRTADVATRAHLQLMLELIERPPNET